LRAEATFAPQHERPQLALGVAMPRPGLCRVVSRRSARRRVRTRVPLSDAA
jgi:hypothetical protein